MFSRNTSSSFSDLFLGLEKVIQSKITGLEDIKTYHFGIDKQVNAFPYLNVYPISEVITRMYTGNYCDVKRLIRFEVRSFKPTQEASFGQAAGICNNIKNIFSKKGNSDFWRLKHPKFNETMVFNTKVSDINFEDPVMVNRGIHGICSIDVTFFCQAFIGEVKSVIVDTLSSTTNPKELMKIIKELLEKYKSTPLLSQINSFKYGMSKPLNKLPGIAVTISDAHVENTHSGVDTLSLDCLISLYHSALTGGKENFYNHLQIIHNIRNIIYANKYFLNRVYNYQFGDINFGVGEVSENLTFISQLNLITSSLDSYH